MQLLHSIAFIFFIESQNLSDRAYGLLFSLSDQILLFIQFTRGCFEYVNVRELLFTFGKLLDSTQQTESFIRGIGASKVTMFFRYHNCIIFRQSVSLYLDTPCSIPRNVNVWFSTNHGTNVSIVHRNRITCSSSLHNAGIVGTSLCYD